jgi:hypothetical protein
MRREPLSVRSQLKLCGSRRVCHCTNGSQLEDFSLDKSADYSDTSCEGRFHQEAALVLLSTFEVKKKNPSLVVFAYLPTHFVLPHATTRC